MKCLDASVIDLASEFDLLSGRVLFNSNRTPLLGRVLRAQFKCSDRIRKVSNVFIRPRLSAIIASSDNAPTKALCDSKRRLCFGFFFYEFLECQLYYIALQFNKRRTGHTRAYNVQLSSGRLTLYVFTNLTIATRRNMYTRTLFIVSFFFCS